MLFLHPPSWLPLFDALMDSLGYDKEYEGTIGDDETNADVIEKISSWLIEWYAALEVTKPIVPHSDGLLHTLHEP